MKKRTYFLFLRGFIPSCRLSNILILKVGNIKEMRLECKVPFKIFSSPELYFNQPHLFNKKPTHARRFRYGILFPLYNFIKFINIPLVI